MNNVLTNRLSPLIKYPGGKEKELNYQGLGEVLFLYNTSTSY